MKGLGLAVDPMGLLLEVIKVLRWPCCGVLLVQDCYEYKNVPRHFDSCKFSKFFLRVYGLHWIFLKKYHPNELK